MKSPIGPLYTIAWKGATLGPFTIGEVREKLAAGELSRMHQVQVDSRWLSVEEFLSRIQSAEQLPPEGAIKEVTLPAVPAPLEGTEASAEDSPAPAQLPRMSRLAIAAGFCTLGNFVPYVNLVAWIFALLFGWLALRATERHSGLRGRWLAVTSLVVTSFLLIVAITFLVLMALDGRVQF